MRARTQFARGTRVMPAPEPAVKTCRVCARTMPLDAFSPQRATCKKCRSDQTLAWKRGVDRSVVTQHVQRRRRCETPWCGRPACASSPMCGVCERDLAPDSELALTGGRWVRSGLTVKWVSAA